MNRPLSAFLLPGLSVAALLASGCSTVRRQAMAMVSPVADNLALSLQCQGDLKLVEDGVPALILLLDGLVLSAPDNTELRLAAADAYTAYAGAFTGPADRERAAELFGRARAYALEELRRDKRFEKALEASQEEFEAALRDFDRDDVPALYTAATAWTGWIISQSNSVAATAELPRPLALMRRVMELDRGYRQGGADTFFGIAACIQPRGAGQDLAKARKHFEESIALAGPDYLFPQVAQAEFYARYAFDRELHDRLLRAVVSHSGGPAHFNLMNAIARKRARELLADADDWF